MDISTFLPQLGTAGIFAFFAWKLYQDMRADSKEREEKLMAHLEKQGEINKEVAETLKQIHDRLCNVEKKVSE